MSKTEHTFLYKYTVVCVAGVERLNSDPAHRNC